MDVATRVTMTRNVRDTLAEDIGNIDWTSQPVNSAASAGAVLMVREATLLYGGPWFEETLRWYEPGITIRWFVGEGEWTREGQTVCQIVGPVRSILTAERTALNFIQLLSDVATVTHALVEVVKGTKTRIPDTRRTLPGLRLAQKYAVRIGGGGNCRRGLYDSILIRENHVAAGDGTASTVRAAQVINTGVPIQAEVGALDKLAQVLFADAGTIFLDNFSLEQVQEAVRVGNRRTSLKVSGGVTRETLRATAETGVDHISVGGFTKHIRAVDFSLRVGALGVQC